MGQTRPNRGRPTESWLRETRELIERFHLMGYSASRIADELRALPPETQRDLTAEAVADHITAIRKGWLDRASDNDALRSDIIGHYQSVIAESTRGAAARRGTTMELGYNRLRLDAAEKAQRLAGLEVRKVEVSGPGGGPMVTETRTHPLDGLAPADVAARLREWADDLDDDEADGEGDA